MATVRVKNNHQEEAGGAPADHNDQVAIDIEVCKEDDGAASLSLKADGAAKPSRETMADLMKRAAWLAVSYLMFQALLFGGYYYVVPGASCRHLWILYTISFFVGMYNLDKMLGIASDYCWILESTDGEVDMCCGAVGVCWYVLTFSSFFLCNLAGCWLISCNNVRFVG